jgi:hypothetical protein
MTWWISNEGGTIELRDNDRVVAIFYNNADAEEILGMHDLIEAQGRLLSGAVNALRGEPPPDTLWSHHDVAELARETTAHLTKLGMFVALCRGSLPVFVDTATKLLADVEKFEQRMQTPISQGGARDAVD